MPANDPLALVQRHADRSAVTAGLGVLQSRANAVIQREVDRSPITPHGSYGPDGTLAHDKSKGVPRWAQYGYKKDHAQVDQSSSPSLPGYGPERDDPGCTYSQGVPNWAKQEYKDESKVKLIASIKDGLIGSIYFANGRIRTTHSHGPKVSKHDPAKVSTSQYNIDRSAAWQLFHAKNNVNLIFRLLYSQTDQSDTADDRREEAEHLLDKTYKRWLSDYLVNTPVDRLPNWVTPVPGHDDAFDTDAADPPNNITLFEVFTKVSNGKVQKWHPSRGIAAKFETNKQVVSVLKAAIRHIDGVTDLNERNTKFYDFIKERLPVFANQIRKPDQV